MEIAVLASERQVPKIVRAAVFYGDNVLDMECIDIIVLAQLAVLALIARPVRHYCARDIMHEMIRR